MTFTRIVDKVNILHHTYNSEVGVMVYVFSNDEVIYEKGFGKSRLDTNQALTSNTMMSIQSISKSFAAASVMYLVERGLIDLRKPVIDYLPYFRTADKKKSDLITVKQLLSHTAGFPDDVAIANAVCSNRNDFPVIKKWIKDGLIKQVYSEEGLSKFKKMEDITKYFSTVDLAYPTGEGWIYCTDAYVIVGDLFEKVSGEKWDHFVQQNIFDQLEMKRTTLLPEVVLKDRDSARYYTSKSDQVTWSKKYSDEPVLVDTPFPSNLIAAPIGFIYSTAKDLSKYLKAIMNGSFLVSDGGLGEMFCPIGKMNGEKYKDTYYGLGWMSRHVNGHRYVEHSGGYWGVNTHVCMVPDHKIGAIVLSNFDGTPSKDIADIALEIILS